MPKNYEKGRSGKGIRRVESRREDMYPAFQMDNLMFKAKQVTVCKQY